MRLSYSQLEWFLRCPYLYKYQFIDKQVFPKGKDAAFGGLLHRALEELYKRKPIIPTLTELLSFYEEEWQKRSLHAYFANEVETNVHFKEGMRMLKDFYESNDIGGTHILALEQFFNVPVQDRQTGQIHTLSGRIDRIDKTKEGIEIIDYKTSRVLKSKKQTSGDLQLSLYHLGVSFLWPEMIKKYRNRISVALYFLRHGEKVIVKKTPEELKATEDTLLRYIRDIEEAIRTNTFEPRPSLLCAREPYARICPFFRDRYRQEKPKIREHEVGDVVTEYLSLKEQERQIKTRIAQLNEMIHDYLDEQKLEGIFDGDKGITRSHSPLYEFDRSLLKEILDELGKWEEVLDISQSKLKKILKELPEVYREKIKKAQKVKGVSKSLRIKKI